MITNFMLLIAATVVYYVCVVTVCLGDSCSISSDDAQNLILSYVTVLEVVNYHLCNH